MVVFNHLLRQEFSQLSKLGVLEHHAQKIQTFLERKRDFDNFNHLFKEKS